MKSWYSMRADETGAEVLVYDEIGLWGVSARQFVDDLKALGKVRDLVIRINSPGGSGFDAVAIYSALARHPAQKAVWIDGFAASAASVIAMAGDEIIMPANTMLMIHDPVAIAIGGAAEMRAMAGALDRAKTAMVGIYAAKSERSAEEIGQLMTDETWMSAQEAVDLGFADRVVDPVAIAARFDLGKFRAKRPPERLVALLKEGSMLTETSAPAPEDAGLRVEQPEAETPAAPAEAKNNEVMPAEPQADADVALADPRVEEPGSEPAPSLAVEARTVALAYAREVSELCVLAGFADRAAGFIKAETAVDAVRAALLEARAAADARIAIDGSREPRAGRMPADAGWGDAIARVFKQ